MATIRIALSAGAALIALMAIVPAASQAQAQKAPLQLVPGPDQAKKSTRAATANAAKAQTGAKTSRKAASNQATRTVASRKNARQTAAATQPSSSSARNNPHSKKTASAMANRRPGQTTTNAQRARVANSHRATPTVAAASPPILRRPAPAPQVFAQGSDDQAAPDNVMRDGDSISLIARLPWWRNDRLQDIQYGSVAAENAVMAAAEVWLAANGGEAAADGAPGQTLALAAPEEAIEIADAGQVNDIDLAAVPAPPAPTFLQSLVALLGGVAAAAAASARFLFA